MITKLKSLCTSFLLEWINTKGFPVKLCAPTHKAALVLKKYNRAIFLWNGCRSLEKLSEFLQTNIGEGCDANTEITTETKESVAS